MIVNSRGSNGSKSSRGVYKITSLALSLLNPTSPAPTPHSAPQSPSSHAALHRLHSPPRHAAAPDRVVPALHSTSCCTAAPLSPLPTLPHRRSPLRCARTPLPIALRRRSTVSTPHRVAPPLHRLHSPTGPIHHGWFWRIHQ
jgi:hypothetical protein